MSLFGTDDVIYVPEGSPLVFDDVYHWRRYKIDVRRIGLRIRPGALDEVAVRMRGALDICVHSPRFAQIAGQLTENTGTILRDLAQAAGQAEEALHGSLVEFFRSGSPAWWIRLSDLPAESFFADDYEREARAEPPITPYHTYGLVSIAQLDGLGIELPGDDEEGMPFSLDVPTNGGMTRWTMPTREPLALVREYCGSHGASAHGHTLNLDTHAVIAASHQFCTPLGRVGSRLFATLYISHTIADEAPVIGRIPDERLPDAIDLLAKSKFIPCGEGPTWRLFEREGDVVHLYGGLAGKESEGIETMPAFLLVACAAGETDPQHRSELYEAIRETLG